MQTGHKNLLRDVLQLIEVQHKKGNMKQILRVVLGWIALLIAACSYANDSLARVGAGGLVLEKTDNIQMVSEVLEISTSKIRVTYHFLNTSDHDIKTTVAFPLPPIIDFQNDPGAYHAPLDSFRMFVNGAEVSVHKNRLFLVNNVDVTDKLRKIGLSDDQIFNPNFDCMSVFPGSPYQRCFPTEEQNAAIKSMDADNGEIKETAYWEQTFPAGKEVEVVHEYKPFTGHNNYGRPHNAPPNEECMDDSTRKAINSRFGDENSAHPVGSPPVVEDVEYILGTGRNWKGPIKNFKLILRKESPNDVVSLCFPGKAKKTSPTTIEFLQTDYVPQDRLIVYFYLVH